MFCSFLALVLKAELDARIAALGHNGSWPAILADLDALIETEVEQDGRRFLLRSAPRPAAGWQLAHDRGARSQAFVRFRVQDHAKRRSILHRTPRIHKLGLTKDWAARIIRHVGNYCEVYERNVGNGSKLGIPRGLNQLWNAGGILYAPPIR